MRWRRLSSFSDLRIVRLNPSSWWNLTAAGHTARARSPQMPKPSGAFRRVSSNDTLAALWRHGEGRRSEGCGMPTVAVEGQFSLRGKHQGKCLRTSPRPCLGRQRGRLPDRVERGRLHGPASPWQLPGHHASLREARSGDQGGVGRHPQEVADGHGSSRPSGLY